jgi:hypothetical protein
MPVLISLKVDYSIDVYFIELEYFVDMIEALILSYVNSLYFINNYYNEMLYTIVFLINILLINIQLQSKDLRIHILFP